MTTFQSAIPLPRDPKAETKRVICPCPGEVVMRISGEAGYSKTFQAGYASQSCGVQFTTFDILGDDEGKGEDKEAHSM